MASFTKQLAVLLLRHALASLLNYRTHTDLTRFGWAAELATDTKASFYRKKRGVLRGVRDVPLERIRNGRLRDPE
jgi:hypothetical protein